MPTNFHESYAASEIRPPSERSTGLLFVAVAVIVAVLWRNVPTVLWVALGMAAILAVVILIAPVLLKPLNILWFQFGLLLHRVVNPIVMFAVFTAVFVPAGAMMRLWRDPLRLRRHTTGASTYWIERRESGDAEGSMTNQF
jgi:predicted membrane metal-binding protein